MNYWSQIPIVRIIIPFALGIAIRANGGYFHNIFIAISILLVILFWLLDTKLKLFKKHKYSFYSGVLLSFTLIFLGMAMCHSRIGILNCNHYSNYISNDCSTAIEITSDVHLKPNSVKFYGEIEAVHQDSIWEATQGKVLLYISKDSISSQLKMGDKLVVSKPPSTLQGPQNPHEFDYRQYLYNHNIYYQYYLYPKDYLWIEKERKPSIKSIFISMRKWMLDRLTEFNIDGKEYAVISALVLGRKDDLDKDLFESYSSAGAMHVLAVSGLHVGLIYVVLMKMLLILNKIRHGKYIRAIIILIGLWLYAGITGMSPSVMRAATMFTFIVIGGALKRPANIYNTLAASALVLLILDPFLLMEVGFQLSYLAVLGIVYLQPKINSLIYSRYWLVEKVWEITSVSIAAQIATFPLGLLYFHQFPNYFLLSNLFVIPLATVILYTSFVFFLVSWFLPLASVVAKILSIIVKVLNAAISSMQSLPFNKLEGISITTFETLIIYFFILMTIFIFVQKRMKYITLSLASLLLIVCINTHERVSQGNQQELLFHKISGESAISVSCGKTNHFICSSRLFHNTERMQFHVKNHIDYLGIDRTVFHNIDSLNNFHSKDILIDEMGFIKVGEIKMLILNDSLLRKSFNRRIEVDILIASKNLIYDLKDIDKSIEFKCLLLDGSNSSYCIDQLQHACEVNGIAFKDLRNGAWLISTFENIVDE